jgi:hypothetical protein
MDKTLEALRRLRDARHRKATIEKIRQERVAAQTAQQVTSARERMIREIVARQTLARRVSVDAGSGRVTARALTDTVYEDISRTRAAGLAHIDVMRAGELHRKEEGRLAELQVKLNRAQANVEKIDRVATDLGRVSRRRADAREEDQADDAALRSLGARLGAAPEDGEHDDAPHGETGQHPHDGR